MTADYDRASFIKTRNSLLRVLSDAGLDDQVVENVAIYLEQMTACILANNGRINALERRITRQETRQKAENLQKPTGGNILEFPLRRR